MMAFLVEAGKDFVERDLVASVRLTATLLVSSVRRDSINPRSERRLPSECVDPSDRVPERVLHGFLGILLVTGDPERQAIRALAVSGDEPFGRRRLAPPQAIDERLVAVGSDTGGGSRAAGVCQRTPEGR